MENRGGNGCDIHVLVFLDVFVVGIIKSLKTTVCSVPPLRLYELFGHLELRLCDLRPAADLQIFPHKHL